MIEEHEKLFMQVIEEREKPFIGGLKDKEVFCFLSVLLTMLLACDNEIHFQEIILKFLQERWLY